jgi:glycosyltransferase involved in cell wall biosynthesis
MTLSVIIPSFNRLELLLQALHSVVRQTRPPDEIWVIDDGSTDDTQCQVAAEFPAVKLLFQPNRGVSAARNLGILRAAGEWLAFLDSDDLWKREKIERQLAALQRFPEFRLCYTDEEWRKNDCWMNQKKKHRKYSGWIYPHCLPLCIISPSSAVIHRSVFEQVGCSTKRCRHVKTMTCGCGSVIAIRYFFSLKDLSPTCRAMATAVHAAQPG